MAKTAKSVKITKEELEHDEVLELTDHAFFWLKTHANKILGVLIVIFAAYTAYVLYKNYQESRVVAANDAFFEAQKAYNAALERNAWGSPERIAAMRDVVLKADQVRSQFPETALARNALFLKGNAYYFAGDEIPQSNNTRDAIKAFEQYATEAKANGDVFEQAAALLALGYANENLSMLENSAPALAAAVESYKQVEALKDAGFLKWEAKVARARLLGFAYEGKEQEAIDLFKEVALARYNVPDDSIEFTNQREMVMRQLRSIAKQFTAGSTAMVALSRLGVDTDEFSKEIAESRKGAKSS